MEISIKCAHEGVTTGEWSDTMRDVFGEYRAPTGIVSSSIKKRKTASNEIDILSKEIESITKKLKASKNACWQGLGWSLKWG